MSCATDRQRSTLGHLAIDVSADAAKVAATIAANPEMPPVSIVAGRHAVRCARHGQLRHERVLVSPHVGYLSAESDAEYARAPAQNVVAWYREGRPNTPIG